jgi:beta-galactosidase
LGYVDNYFSVLLPMIAALTYANGGPVIMVQVENEYGSYGSDHAYLAHIQNLMATYEVNAVLFASNGYSAKPSF